MFDTALTTADLLFLARGAGVTIIVTLISVALGTILGIAFGVIRYQVGPWWAAPLTFVLDVFRSIPLLIQLVLANAFMGMVGPAPVSFRSFESNTRHQGDRIWQRYTATSSSGMRFASRSPVA